MQQVLHAVGVVIPCMAFGGGAVAYGERDAVDKVVPADGVKAMLWKSR